MPPGIETKTAAEWASENPVLDELVTGLETDTGLTKVGDGITAWNSLSYTTSEAVIDARMFQRRDTVANWTSTNPLLVSGEIAFETDTGKFKIGNGTANWTNLTYHPHDAADITNGTLDTARLGSGTANSTTFLRGDQTWTTVSTARNRSVSVFVSGRATDAEVVWRDIVTNATSFTIAANSTNCVANATTAATGSPVFQVQRNGANVGNFTWAANGTVGTANFPANVSFVAGDVRQIVANATSDPTLAFISITIGGEA